MITANQIVVHILADYFCQSDWMAVNKKNETLPCLIHCLIYTAIFWLFFTPGLLATLFIFGTHFAIDRFGLARFPIWAKNFMNPTFSNRPFSDCNVTGFYDLKAKEGDKEARPFFITIWLYIIMDNTLHLICNGFALTYLN
jgi:hypothetical protein